MSEILFVDVSELSLKKKCSNSMTPEHISAVLQLTRNRSEAEHSHLAGIREIEGNGYELSVVKYVRKERRTEEVKTVTALIEEMEQRAAEYMAAIECLKSELKDLLDRGL